MIYIALLTYAGQVWLIHTLTTPIEASHHIINVYQHTFLDITPIIVSNLPLFVFYIYVSVILSIPGDIFLQKQCQPSSWGYSECSPIPCPPLLPFPRMSNCHLCILYIRSRADSRTNHVLCFSSCVWVNSIHWILQNQSPSLDIKGNLRTLHQWCQLLNQFIN